MVSKVNLSIIFASVLVISLFSISCAAAQECDFFCQIMNFITGGATCPDCVTGNLILEEPSLEIQTTTVLQPGSEGKDARIWSGTHASTNYGSDGYLSVFDNSGDGTTNSLIQFDLSSIPSNAIILKANLSLQSGSNYQDIAIYRTTQSWDEGTVTWSNKPTYDASLIDIKNVSNSVRTEFDVTDSLQEFVNGTYTNYGWYLAPYHFYDFSMSFYSSDYGTASYRPKLTVEYLSCGSTITRNISLNEGLIGCTGNGLNIGAENIEIDCKGYNISGTGASSGIRNSIGAHNITIKNCNINDFSEGIYSYTMSKQGNNLQVINCTINANNQGVYIAYGNNNKIYNSKIYGTNYGIFFSSSGGNIVSNSAVLSPLTELYASPSLSVFDLISNSTGYSTKVSFTSSQYIKIDRAEAIAGSGLRNIGKYFNLTSSNNDIDFVLNMSYDNSDIIGVNESTLKLYEYNGTAWILANISSGINGVDTVNNVVYAEINMSEISSAVFAPMGEGIISCGSVITDDINLTEGLIGCTGNGINIGANNIVLDCKGHSIIGTGSSYGIHVNGYNGTIIKNCNVSSFDRGIVIENSNNNLINNSRFSSPNTVMRIYSSSGNEISDSYFDLSGSSIPAVEIIWYSNNNKLVNSLISASSQAYSGITISGSSFNNQLIGDKIIANSLLGGYSAIDISSNNTILTNILVQCSGKDFSSGASNVSVVNMTFNSSAYPTKASFTFSGGVKIDSSNAIADTGILNNISKYLNITNTSAASVQLNISYLDYDIANLTESSLRIFRYNGTGWGAVAGSGVDTVNNIVYANLNSFSVFAPMTEELPSLSFGDNVTENSVITSNITGSGTALNIKANNLVIDCNGNAIIGSGSGDGINAQRTGTNSYSNTTLKNCIILNFTNGINSAGTSQEMDAYSGGSVRVINSTIGAISTNGASAMNGGNGGDVIIISSNINGTINSGGATGSFGPGNGGSINITNSNVGNLNAGAGYADGGGPGGNAGNILLENSIAMGIDSGGGDSWDQGGQAGNVILINSSAISFGLVGGSGRSTGIGGNAGNVTAINSNFNLSNISVSLPKGTGAGGDGLDGTLKLNNTELYNTLGKIKFSYVSTNKTNLTAVMGVSSNLISLDSTTYSDYNVSANLTLNSISGFSRPIIIRNGIECNSTTSPSCVNYTSLSGNVVFGVSSFTNYSIAETPFEFGSTITENITLSDNINGNGTAIVVGADNITIDCAGYSMTGNLSGDGIEIDGYNGITIKNCNLSVFYNGIYLANSENSTITNNIINENGFEGIELSSSNYNNITNNIVNNNTNQFGIYLINSNSNNIINNTANYDYSGVYVETSSYNVIENNTFDGSSDAGAYLLSASSYNNFTNNTVSASGAAGILIDSSDSNVFKENTVDSNGAGIGVFGSSSNTFLNDELNNPSTIDLESVGCSDIIITNMTFSSTGYPTKASFIYSGDIDLYAADAVEDADGLKNISKYINIDDLGSANVQLNISYNESDLGLVSESTLKIYEWDGGNWVEASSSGVDTVNNVVYATIGTFSTYGVLGGTNTAPNVTSVNISSDSFWGFEQGFAANLTCNATLIDNEETSLTAYYTWYKNDLFNSSGSAIVSNGTESTVSVLDLANIGLPGENWTCEIIPYDGIENGTAMSYFVVITPGNPPQAITALNITLAPNKQDIILGWDWVPNAVDYQIWYSENMTFIKDMVELVDYSSPPNVTLIGRDNITWTDTTANLSKERYYAVSAQKHGIYGSADYSAGKYTVTISSEAGAGQTLAALMFNETKNLSEIIPSTNAFSFIYAVNESGNDQWDYAYYTGSGWDISGGLTEIESEKGYYFSKFDNEINFTNVGVVRVGTVTKKIHSKSNVGQTLLGWDSFNEGDLNTLINETNAFSFVYTVNDTANKQWLYAYYTGIAWDTSGGLTKLKRGKGYYFRNFDSELNLSYYRNP